MIMNALTSRIARVNTKILSSVVHIDTKYYYHRIFIFILVVIMSPISSSLVLCVDLLTYYLLFLVFIVHLISIFISGMNDNIQRLKNLTPISNTTTEWHMSDKINNKSQSIESIDDLVTKKFPVVSTTIKNNDDQRTVLARHIFSANIEHTLIRFIRETPV